MKRYKKIALLIVIIQLVVGFTPCIPFAEAEEEINFEPQQRHISVQEALHFLKDKQMDEGSWGDYGKRNTADIANILEYTYNNAAACSDEDYNSIDSMLNKATDYIWYEGTNNIDDFSKYLLIDGLQNYQDKKNFVFMQNPDGGFGINEGYASDILDTSLALKALTDLEEMEAMTNAACYLAALQNGDGGFPYQPGLASDPLLTAEIADSLADCVKGNEALKDRLSETISKLDGYLDACMVPTDELSADNLSAVYRQLHTALFRLKLNGRFDTSQYAGLQGENGGVLDDPMATALFLELLVREQNAVTASLYSISITNSRGSSVSVFNAEETVNIAVEKEYEAEKAYLNVSIVPPSGEPILLDPEHPVWNTGDYEEGTYTVEAKIIHKSNSETIASMKRTFQIKHRLAVDSVGLVLSQSFARVGEEAKVDISAAVSLKSFSDEAGSLILRWNGKCNDEILFTGNHRITEADLAADAFSLGAFTPDTSERKTYLITAELLSNGQVMAQSTTNFFVSDQSVAVVRGVNKDFLYEAADDAEVTVKIRDERVVDLIFTTSSDNTAVISPYSEKIGELKTELENLGYLVNLCSVSTSCLTAQDTFAWTEYDHPNYNTQPPYTQHIVYDGNNIKMLGYTVVPYKDFLLVPDNHDSQKLFDFDIQRDKTDWHSMNGGGFLFNTVIEDNVISGYYVLVTYGGLRLYQLDGLKLDSFRNSSAAGTLLKTFPFPNPYSEHHIKIAVDSQTLSLWDGETPVINSYELPEVYGNGYGPITSHAGHDCWQRSYFTFANIRMQTITGEKLSDILDNFNFESKTSRYVINLSDNFVDDLSTEEEVKETAKKIIDKNICFIGLGNDKNEAQYQSLIRLIADKGLYYGYTEETTAGGLSDYIVRSEESKRVKEEDQILATDLVFTGNLYDGTQVRKSFDHLSAGETLEIKIPVALTGLTAGTDAVLLQAGVLDYKDENGINRTRQVPDVTIPVRTPDGKISNRVSTEKPEYLPYKQVKIFDRIHNTSKNRTAKNLTHSITVLNADGVIMAEYTAELPEIMPGGYVERQEVWNTADYGAGEYQIRSEIYDNEVLIAQSTEAINVTVPDVPEINLIGELKLSGKQFLMDDVITIEGRIENAGHVDVTNAQAVIKIVDTKDGTVVYQYETPFSLAVSETGISSISVTPQNDFVTKKNEKYLVIYEAVMEDSRVIPLAADGFLLDRGAAKIMGSHVLFSSNTSAEQTGILMNGSMITINGGVHSNTSIEINCAALKITDLCESILPAVFNTGQAQLEKGVQAAEVSELSDFLTELRERLINTEISVNGGWVSENREQTQIGGNYVTAAADLYSDKTIVIDSPSFSSDNTDGILLSSGGDIVIRSADVNFKGIIYAPNGTVKIETSNFTIQGRIIAKNIVYRGSTFTGEAYDRDLDLLS